VRNAVSTGADPATIVLLDNFCWPDPVQSAKNSDGKYKLAQLVRACEGLSDAVAVYGTPLISGKDSMKNDFDDGVVRLSIPPTLLISAMGRLPHSDDAISMDFKSCGDIIYLICAGGLGLAGSQYASINEWRTPMVPKIDLERARELYKRMHDAISRGWVKSCHDVSDGGIAVTLAECAIGSGLGAQVSMEALAEAAKVYRPSDVGSAAQRLQDRDFALFAEGPARLVVTVQPELRQEFETLWSGFACLAIGEVVQQDGLTITERGGTEILRAGQSELVAAWKTPLPFD
jgi:phosphoribosylformylglycinamidine synthase